MKNIVMPGELLSDKPLRIENTFIQNNMTYSKVLGLYDSETGSIVPLEGPWRPRAADTVVGIIAGEKNNVYEVDLGYFARTILIADKFERTRMNIGDVIESKIRDI